MRQELRTWLVYPLVVGGLAATTLTVILCHAFRSRCPCGSDPMKIILSAFKDTIPEGGRRDDPQTSPIQEGSVDSDCTSIFSNAQSEERKAIWLVPVSCHDTLPSCISTDTDARLQPDLNECISDPPSSLPSDAQVGVLHFTPLPLPRLHTPDRRDILGQRWLSDDVIDLAQELLQRQFPDTRGLYACGAAFTLPPLQPGSTTLFLQVVNRSAKQHLSSMTDYGRPAGSHWLLLSFGAACSGQLAVYDSMYDSLSTSTAALVRQLQKLHVPPPGAKLRPVQRQQDGHSCGLFALAFAFSISHGQDPCCVHYIRVTMEHHLIWCLENAVVKPFPAVSKGAED